jgi:hypothetical protein
VERSPAKSVNSALVCPAPILIATDAWLVRKNEVGKITKRSKLTILAERVRRTISGLEKYLGFSDEFAGLRTRLIADEILGDRQEKRWF